MVCHQESREFLVQIVSGHPRELSFQIMIPHYVYDYWDLNCTKDLDCALLGVALRSLAVITGVFE
jgi:hypothetical protein